MPRCSTPEKLAYPTKQAANRAIRSHDGSVRVYRCKCRSFHLTSAPVRKPKRRR